VSIGRLRTRLAVAAKIALATAALTAAVGASPMPPGSSLLRMDEAMIANWNEVVAKGDVVWHLGDFAVRCELRRMRAIFSRLNGSKHLVPGNHDGPETLKLAWASVGQIREIKVEGQRLVLCHFALRTWPGVHRGALHLFGHSHGSLPGNAQCADVGVDCWSFRPVTLPTIRMALEASAVEPPIP
jgi:calcineurin-like phosphoesterase family protein